eukprot:TRINITY_DN4051_c1_g1_i2.p1 TRINITY_DN4051_c1_g1~~TRINITY_DN4051_c1_g1_i2.p1  ORF type:complete len:101 (-),score=3.35 TRINITY_DN4051_c1_g1_i2:92-394(-)
MISTASLAQVGSLAEARHRAILALHSPSHCTAMLALVSDHQQFLKINPAELEQRHDQSVHARASLEAMLGFRLGNDLIGGRTLRELDEVLCFLAFLRCLC